MIRGACVCVSEQAGLSVFSKKEIRVDIVGYGRQDTEQKERCRSVSLFCVSFLSALHIPGFIK